MKKYRDLCVRLRVEFEYQELLERMTHQLKNEYLIENLNDILYPNHIIEAADRLGEDYDFYFTYLIGPNIEHKSGYNEEITTNIPKNILKIDKETKKALEHKIKAFCNVYGYEENEVKLSWRRGDI